MFILQPGTVGLRRRFGVSGTRQGSAPGSRTASSTRGRVTLPQPNGKRAGADDRTIQAILGHTDRRSVERYARLADGAVVEVLKGAEEVRGADDAK